MSSRHIFIAGSALVLVPVIAMAQDGGPPPDVEPAIVEGLTIAAAVRGPAVGDIPPENILRRPEMRATGANSVEELLSALSPQIGTGRGDDGPIVLLNGQRISSFRELRDLPVDAVSRAEILPEDVALKYGYRADQRVVNIVLQEFFISNSWLARGMATTSGGYFGGMADGTRLTIAGDERTTLNLQARANSNLTENERDIAQGEASRSLVASQRNLRLTLTRAQPLGAVNASGNVEVAHDEGQSLIGLGQATQSTLARDTSRSSAHVGLGMVGRAGEWHWSSIGNLDASREMTHTERDAAGGRDRTSSHVLSADLDTVANGALFNLPAGDASATVHVGISSLRLTNNYRQNGATTSNSLERNRGEASISMDMPLSRRGAGFSPFGNLTLNGNAAVQKLSDFETLTTHGAGLYWSPVARLDFTASWSREEGAPSVQDLGDPAITTPKVRVFDFASGQTVTASTLTGGNPGLQADRRNLFNLGANWKPFAQANLRLRADYVSSRISNPVVAVHGPSIALEAALPQRFVRDQGGKLVSLDLRPANFERAKRDTLSLGFDYSRPLKATPPSQASAEAYRQRVTAAGGQLEGEGGPPPRTIFGPGDEPPAASPPPTSASPVRTIFGPGDGPGEGGMQAGPANQQGSGNRVRLLWGPQDAESGGSITLSLTDTITLTDEVTVGAGRTLDYLDGEALGQTGGRPRHHVQGLAGYFNDGFGVIATANWRSGSRVESPAGDLRFSPYASVDLGLFTRMDQRYDLINRFPWLEGVSAHFDVKNLFDAKPRVRDGGGAAPAGYHPSLLDPLGQRISITFRRGAGGAGG